MKPLIGITTGIIPNPNEWGPRMYVQNHQYSDAVFGAGGVPVLLPQVPEIGQLRDLYDHLDGILFAGGGDIDPKEYGEAQHPEIGEISAERDWAELQCIKWAIADDKPFLAICRGFQVMNVALGGSLFQDIAADVPGAQDHELSTAKHDKTFIAHRLRLDPYSRLAQIIGNDTIGANTHHHQAVKKPAPGMRITGWAEDGIIESGELGGSRFAIGVQCHPESLARIDPGWQKVFAAFVQAAQNPAARPAYESADSARSSSNIDEPAEAL